MESLSEAVSGLILLVISFQESGAPMPPHIPPAAVCSSSQNSLLFTFNLFFNYFFILLFSSFSHFAPTFVAGLIFYQDGVTTTSNTLADVASGIATDEYGDYPEIQNPILDAAKGA